MLNHRLMKHHEMENIKLFKTTLLQNITPISTLQNILT